MHPRPPNRRSRREHRKRMYPMRRDGWCAAASHVSFAEQIEPFRFFEPGQQGPALSFIFGGMPYKVAIVVDVPALAVVARKPLEIGFAHSGKAASLPIVEQQHQITPEALDNIIGANFGKTLFIQRHHVMVTAVIDARP